VARNDVNVRIGGKETVSKASAKAVKSIKNLGSASQKVGRNIMAAWSQATIIIMGVTRAFRAVERAMQAGAEEYRTRLEAEQRLTNAVEASAEALNLNVESMLAYSDAMSTVTQFGDELIDETQSILATFGRLGGDVMPRATEATLNLASALDQDLARVAQRVGLALADPERASRALRQMNVILTNSQEDLIKSFVEAGDEASAMGIILDQLDAQFGGFAEAVGQSSIGVISRFENLKGDITEVVGEITTALRVSFINSIQPVLEGFLDWLDANAPAIYAVFANIGPIMLEVGRYIVTVLRDTFKWENFSTLVSNIGGNLLEVFGTAIAQIPILFGAVFDALNELAEASGRTTGELFAEAFRNALGDFRENIQDWTEENITQPLRDIFARQRGGGEAAPSGGTGGTGFNPLPGMQNINRPGGAAAPIVLADLAGAIAEAMSESFAGVLVNIRASLAEAGTEIAGTLNDVYGESTSEFTAALQDIIAAGSAEFRAFQAREIATGATGVLDEDEIMDAIDSLVTSEDEQRKAALEQAQRLAMVQIWGEEAVRIQDEILRVDQSREALSEAGFTDLADTLKDTMDELQDQLKEVMQDPTGEKARRREALEQASQMATLVRYGQEYISLQEERVGVLDAFQTLVSEGFYNQAFVLSERLSEIDERLSDLANPTDDGGGAGDAIAPLLDAFGGLEGIVGIVADGLGGMAGSIVSLVSSFGAMGLLVLALGQILQGLLGTLGPVINRILDPVLNFLQLLGEIIATALIPVFNALSPILMLIVQVLSSLTPLFVILEVALAPLTMILGLLTPIFQALAVVIEVVMSPIRFLGDLFTWIAQKIKFSVMNFAAWLLHPFSERRRESYLASQGASDPGAFSSDAFSGLADRIAEILSLSGAAPTAGDVQSIMDLISSNTGINEFGGLDTGDTGIYGGSVTVTQPPDIYISVHIGEGGVTVMGTRELREIGDVVVRAVQEVLDVGGKVTWLQSGAQ